MGYELRWRHMIRNCIFRRESLGISYFWVKIFDSGHAQVAIYTVFHEESESAVRIDQFLHPGAKIKKFQPTRVSISYRKISYHTPPPYESPVIFVGNLRISNENPSTFKEKPYDVH